MPIPFRSPARILFGALAAMAGLAAFLHSPQQPPAARRHGPIRHGPIHVRRHRDGSLKRGLRNEWISDNWAGYALANFQDGRKYARARMSWVVPKVSHGSSTDSVSSIQYSATWVGIGGFCKNSVCSRADNTLLQLGTEQDVAASGATQYYAWYEMLPQIETPLPYAVAPGDTMAASLRCVRACAAKSQIWLLTMTDQTRGWTWSERVRYASSMLSAEWIEEAPYYGGILPLADFGTAGFSATNGANGRTPSLSVSANGIQLDDSWGQTANPSAADILADFNACWGYQTDAACPMP